MSKHAVSGFPEWLPEGRAVEIYVEDTLRRVFELHGFSGLRTRSVEPLSSLEAKGETSKEVYLLQRLQGLREGTEKKVGSSSLGLHFDLTVPLARYVVANAGSLVFPFKRYQIQQVWRGERPQEGRFREFTQADIDVVGQGTLPFHFDIEVAAAMVDALNALNIGKVLMGVNNRKLLQGLLDAIGADNFEEVLRSLDKLDKIGRNGVSAELAGLGLSEKQIQSVLSAAEIVAGSGADLAEQVAALGYPIEGVFEEGLTELSSLLDALGAHAPGQVQAALRIARGLDYYTGTVYETVLPGFESFGSICSGGRYDTLATSGSRTFPGVGLSVGVTRLVSLILGAGLLEARGSSPATVMVLVPSEDDRAAANLVAAELRSRSIPAEVSPTSAKFGRQMRYADRKGIPYVWFIGEEGGGAVKNLETGEQVESSASLWVPSADYAKRVAWGPIRPEDPIAMSAIETETSSE